MTSRSKAPEPYRRMRRKAAPKNRKLPGVRRATSSEGEVLSVMQSIFLQSLVALNKPPSKDAVWHVARTVGKVLREVGNLPGLSCYFAHGCATFVCEETGLFPLLDWELQKLVPVEFPTMRPQLRMKQHAIDGSTAVTVWFGIAANWDRD